MADTAELLKQRIRERRKELQTSGSVNKGFTSDEPISPTRSNDSTSLQSEDEETKTMLKELEMRRYRRKQKLKHKESREESIHELEMTKLSELTSNLEEVKQTVLKKSERSSSISSPKQDNNKLTEMDMGHSNISEIGITSRTEDSQSIGSKGNLKPPTGSSEPGDQEERKSITEIDNTMSKSETYRERIRNRMIRAKSIGQSQAMEDEPNDVVNRMKRTTAARQLENEKREEEEIQRKLAERSRAKEMLRRSITKATEESPSEIVQQMPVEDTDDNSFDFFTKEYEEVERVITSETSIAEATDVENPETNESSKLLRDYLTSADQEEVVKVTAIPYIPFRQRIAQENKSYFIPSVVSVPVNDKLQDGIDNPRLAEEEGLYVGVRPDVNRCNLNKMENRIMRSNDTQSWFGEDGIIKALSNPLESVPYSPYDADKEVHDDLTTVYKKAFINGRGYSSPTSGNNYQLDIDLSTCTFNHHPLFSKEHILTKHLQNLYKQYCIICQEDRITYLNHKLAALRVAVANIAIGDSLEDGEKDTKWERLKNYRNQIKVTRLQADKMEASFRKLQKNVIRVWKAIKSIREQQKYVNTSVKLVIHKKNSNKEADQEIWDQEIENEVKDLEDEHNTQYKVDLEKYEKQLSEWKMWNQKRKEAKRKEQTLQKSPQRKGSKTEPEELSLQEEQILNDEKRPRPSPPQPFSTEQMYEEVRAKALRIRRHPGEPVIQFELKMTANVIPISQCPKREEQRRNEIGKRKIFIKILVNNKVVSTTNPRTLNSDFNIAIGQIFNVKVIQWAKEVKLQIFEISSLIAGPTLLAEVFLPVPDVHVTTNNVQLADIEFSCDDYSNFNHEGVGSGIEFRNDCFDSPMMLLTNGIIKCGVSWAVSEDGKILGPPLPDNYNQRDDSLSSAALFSASSIPELYKLVEWVKKSNLDPNDPSNASLLHLIKTIGSKDGVASAPDYFRLDHLQEEFNFATDKEIQENLRFQMIQLRESDYIPEFKNYHMIPLKEKEIPRELFDAYDKRKRRDQDSNMLTNHRLMGSKFLSQVRKQVMNRFRQVQHQKTLEDVITEDEVPDIGTLGFNLLTLTNKRRPLKPMRKDRKKVTAQNIGGTEVKVVLNVGRAMDLPVRTTNKDFGRIRSNVAHGYHQLLRPYVEVMFQRQIIKTSIADGPNPTWNQELQLNFKAPHDNYSPTNLETIRDVIYFNVFDEVVIDLLEDDRDRDTDVHQRMEKRFLGSLNLPFSTVYFNSKVEGTFQLNVPHILLGYDKSHSQRYGAGVFEPVQSVPEINNSFLSIYVTIEPSLPPPDVFREKFDSNELEKLLSYADKWQTDLLYTFPKRNIKTTVIDIQGKTVFITRYFKSIKPPNELLIGSDPVVIAERVARFVSLIPSISDSVMFPGLCDLWSTSDQFLQMLSGDEEEHAVLLCNYFSSLQKEVWLVIGVAVPEGPTAYVLTRETNDIWVWNASTGSHSSVQNMYNSLQSIGCLINQDNIWANVQKNEKPSLMSFDLSRTADWKPFFTRANPHPGLASVQTDNLHYHATDGKFVKDIQERIENTVRENFTRWRCRVQARTRWNRHCKQVLAQILPKLEECAWNRNANSDKVFQEMNQILSSYSMGGFPIQMPYTDVDTVVEAVFSTGLHLNKSEDVEFALAVYVHPYPCDVLAIWVYIASLVHF